MDTFSSGIGKFAQRQVRRNNSVISSSISVYPVPAHTSITITGLPVNGQIFLYDIKGSLVINKNISGSIMNLNVSGLKGNYMLQIISDKDKFEKTILVE